MQYECLTLHVTSGGYRFALACTNPAVLEWIETEIQSSRPYCSFSSGSQLSCTFDIVKYEPLEIGWWLVRSLCEQGWEPFGSVSWEESWGLEFISLRRSIP